METDIKTEVSVNKGNLVFFKRNGRPKVAKVISKGPAKIGLKVFGMKSNTRISSDTEMVEVTLFVTKEVAEELKLVS